MARKVECGKFLVLEVDKLDMVYVFRGPGICDWCGRPIEGNGYYIAVLNQIYDKDCFEEWKKRSTYYPSDAPVEKRNFDYYSKKLRIE